MQTLPGPVAEYATLRTELSQLRGSIETLARERKEAVILTRDVRELMAKSKEIQAYADALRKRGKELACKVREKKSLATMESIRLKAFTEKLISLKPKLAASSVGSANSRWNARSVAKSENKVEEDVSNKLMVVSEEITDATERKVSIIGLELKEALK